MRGNELVTSRHGERTGRDMKLGGQYTVSLREAHTSSRGELRVLKETQPLDSNSARTVVKYTSGPGGVKKRNPCLKAGFRTSFLN